MPPYCKACACTGKKKVAHYGLEGGKKNAHYGLKGSGKKEWCARCAKAHGGVYLGIMCEDCKDKHANYGETRC